MTKTLVLLLGLDEREFRAYIERLEHVTARPSHDIRLTHDVVHSAPRKLQQLSLDPHDTTPRELYYALRSHLLSAEEDFMNKVDFKGKDAEAQVGVVADMAQALLAEHKSLSLTPAGCRRLLEAVPPRRTLKILKLRSLASVTKRYDARMLYTVAKLVEDSSWHVQVQAKLKRMQQRDIEWTAPHISVLPLKWYEKLESHFKKRVLIDAYEVASVVLVPSIVFHRGGQITYLLSLLIERLTNMYVSSLSYGLNSLSLPPQQFLQTLYMNQTDKIEPLHGLSPSWEVVLQVASSPVAKNLLKEKFDHIEGVSFHEPSALLLDKLSEISESYKFFKDSRHIGYVGADGEIVSLNLMDVARDTVLNLKFENRGHAQLHRVVRERLEAMYLGHENMLKKLINSFDDQVQDVLP